MIDSPNENVKLTFEQLQKIDVVNKQLANLQSEIANAQKILKGTKLECDRAVKEKLYQEELSVGLVEQVKTLTAQKDGLVQEVTDFTTALNTLKEKTNEINKQNYEREAELIARMKDLKSKEDAFNAKVSDFTIQSSKLLEDQLSIQTAKEAFLKATETVTW